MTNTFSKTMRINPNHKNFCYEKNYHKPSKYINEYVSNIMKDDHNK